MASGASHDLWKDKPQQGEVAQGTPCVSELVTRYLRSQSLSKCVAVNRQGFGCKGHYRKRQVAEAEHINMGGR